MSEATTPLSRSNHREKSRRKAERKKRQVEGYCIKALLVLQELVILLTIHPRGRADKEGLLAALLVKLLAYLC